MMFAPITASSIRPTPLTLPSTSSSSSTVRQRREWISFPRHLSSKQRRRRRRVSAAPNDDTSREEEEEEQEEQQNVQQIDIRDDAALAKIGLKWNDDYTELLDVKTGKPLDDFEEMQRKQQEASRFDIAVRAMRGEFTKARGKTEGEVYGEIMDTLTNYPIVYTFQASAKVSEEHDVLRLRQQIKETVENRCNREAIEVEIKPRGKKFHSFWVKISVSDSSEVSECIDLLKNLDDVVTCC
jgi:hypothetical protein